jgi:hypothetical protein
MKNALIILSLSLAMSHQAWSKQPVVAEDIGSVFEHKIEENVTVQKRVRGLAQEKITGKEQKSETPSSSGQLPYWRWDETAARD